MRAACLAALLLVACQAQEVSVSSLIGGTSSVLLSAEQQQAIGRLVVGDATLCTGWVVSSRHLVTAAHCFNESVTAGQVDFIPGGVAGGRRVPLVAVAEHPSLDVALVTLGVELSFVTPLQLNHEAPDEGWVGHELEIAGSGFGTSLLTGVTYGSFPVLSFGPELLTVDRSRTQGVCRGDSGGPFLRAFDTAPFTRVVALVSAGAASCEGTTWGPRADVFSAWLSQRMALAVPAQSQACETGAVPRCEGEVAWACVGGWWRPGDCALTGQACGWRSEGEGLGCLPAACGALDGHGACERGVAQWCGPGGVERLDCAARGMECGWDQAALKVQCQPCESAGACGTQGEVVAPPAAVAEPERGGCSVSGAPAVCLLMSAWRRRRYALSPTRALG